jgi:hypothetical protein
MVHSMAARTSFALLLLTLCCACSTAPKRAPAAAPENPAVVSTPAPAEASDLVDHWGDSVTAAVAVPADEPNGGVIWEMNWIFAQYGRFRKTGGGVGNLEGRRYDVLEVEFPDGTHRKVFFDITENFNREVEEMKKSNPQD